MKTSIRNLFLETGKALTEATHPQDINGRARELQDQLRGMVDDPEIRCLVFFLNLVIDDFFYNLSGDNEYDNSVYEVRDNVYMQLGKTLLAISNTPTNSYGQTTWNALCELVSVYLTQLENLQNILRIPNGELNAK